ncbi:Hint domain-containing protein [Hyphomicrobium sp.]|uniref:Hint domain-containing protein n=1 Tax=Hyphomicrobium sp. TaxID=82 RepID=UPI0025BCEE77|nr:Hint domain-containing protein [Hyphomicrobium sp.]
MAGWSPSADGPGHGADGNDRFCDLRGESGGNSRGYSDSSHPGCQSGAGGGGGSGGGGGGGGGMADSGGAGGGSGGGGGGGGGGGNSGGGSANAGGGNSGGDNTNPGGKSSGGGNGDGNSGGSTNAGGGNSGGGNGDGNSGGGGNGWDLGLGGDGPGSNGGGSSWGGGGGVACFLAGTRILTTNFERSVEDLRAGDMLPTISGGTRTIKKIRSWTAARRANEQWRDDVAPIKVCRGALGPNVPQTDLYLSPNHALYVDGVLITVGNLVNGRSIVRCSDFDGDLITYFHIELEDHQVIWANGAPVESRLTESMTPFAPAWSGGRRFEISSRLRSAISPWFDARTQFDKIRDRIEEQSEPNLAVG